MLSSSSVASSSSSCSSSTASSSSASSMQELLRVGTVVAHGERELLNLPLPATH